MTDQDNNRVYTDGDEYVIETPYGEARLELYDTIRHDNLDEADESSWITRSLSHRWSVLFSAVFKQMHKEKRENL